MTIAKNAQFLLFLYLRKIENFLIKGKN